MKVQVPFKNTKDVRATRSLLQLRYGKHPIHILLRNAIKEIQQRELNKQVEIEWNQLGQNKLAQLKKSVLIEV